MTKDTPNSDMPNLLDPKMPAQELRLHMGELTSDEMRVARAAIEWANARATPEPDKCPRGDDCDMTVAYMLGLDRAKPARIKPIEGLDAVLETAWIQEDEGKRTAIVFDDGDHYQHCCVILQTLKAYAELTKGKDDV